MSAREQAREKAAGSYKDDSYERWLSLHAVNAASDVWEPLVREALGFIDGTYMGLASDRQEALVSKLKEALGE